MSQAELEALERLARLLDLQDRIAPKAPARRTWAFAAVLATTLCILSMLLFLRVSRTPIELELETEQLAFTLPSEQILFEQLELTKLVTSGIARVTLPAALLGQLGGNALDEPAPPVTLIAGELDGRRGSIAIKQIRPAARAQIELGLIDQAGQYRLSLAGAGTTIEVGVIGPIRIEVQGRGEAMVDFVAPKGLALEAAERRVKLDFTFRDPMRVSGTPQVPVENPSFRRVDQYGDREVSVLRTLSTILGGTLFFESLGGVAKQLRAGEMLRFREAAGELRTLQLRPDRVALSFHGTVSGMTSGDDDARQSLMPTWLDLLRAQHGLALMWGSTVYIAGLAMGVLRWWKGTP